MGSDLEKGRVLLLASHRLFLNRMMLPTDTDNVEFAQNCLAALAARLDGGMRKKLLFVEYGTVNSKFEVPLKLPELPDNLGEMILAGLLELGNRLPQFQEKLARAEENDEFHRGLWRFLDRRGVRGTDVMRWVLLTVSGLFAIYGFIRLVGPGRYRLDSATPLLPRVIAKNRPLGPLHARRRRAMIENDNLWEAARDRARAELTEAGVVPPRPGDRIPNVLVGGGWWRRWRTRRRVLRLWRLAFDPTPQLVPKSAWALVNRDLAELKAALASGTVRFV